MLDLNFVRDNLPLVESKLRQRGMDPAEVLTNFHEIDTQRRKAITDAETTKARRNRSSEEITKLKKNGRDATALISETKSCANKFCGQLGVPDLERAAKISGAQWTSRW